MKTKIIQSILLVSALLISCKPVTKQLSVEQVDSIPSTEDILNNFEVIDKIEKTNNIDNKDDLILINYTDNSEEYIPDSLLVDSLLKIAKTAEIFIKWYLNEDCPINQSKLFAFSDSLGYYIFDMVYAKFYLNELQKTGVVSDSLIRSLSKTFKQIKVDLENEKYGPEPDGLIDYDVDIIFNSQDIPDPFLEPELKLKSFDFWGSNLSVLFSGGSAARLIYEKGQWKVIQGGF